MSSSCALQINWNHNQVEFFSLFNWRFFLCSGTSDGSFWFLAVSNMAGSSPLYIILACIDHSVVFPLKIYLMNPVKVKLSDHYSWLNKPYFFLKKDWTSFFLVQVWWSEMLFYWSCLKCFAHKFQEIWKYGIDHWNLRGIVCESQENFMNHGIS